MKSLLKVILKIFFALLALLLLASGLLYAIYNDPLPTGQSGPQADALAEKMLTAIHYTDYKNTRYLKWSYAGGRHHYLWDKQNSEVQIEWADYRILLNLNYPAKTSVLENAKEIKGKSKKELIKKAVSYFNNDSFWLVAPFKVFDKGTRRSIVNLENGTKGLLVTYTIGGTTPGDSYLWELSEKGLPENFRLWVDIIPIGGLKATWDDWQVMESGIFLPTSHKLGPINLEMGEVRAYN